MTWFRFIAWPRPMAASLPDSRFTYALVNSEWWAYDRDFHPVGIVPAGTVAKWEAADLLSACDYPIGTRAVRRSSRFILG